MQSLQMILWLGSAYELIFSREALILITVTEHINWFDTKFPMLSIIFDSKNALIAKHMPKKLAQQEPPSRLDLVLCHIKVSWCRIFLLSK